MICQNCGIDTPYEDWKTEPTVYTLLVKECPVCKYQSVVPTKAVKETS